MVSNIKIGILERICQETEFLKGQARNHKPVCPEEIALERDIAKKYSGDGFIRQNTYEQFNGDHEVNE